MQLGDASLLLVHLDRERIGSALLEALPAAGDVNVVRLLDVIVVTRRAARRGSLTEIDVSELALAGITLRTPGLIGVEDAAGLTAHLDIGASAAIILVEHSAAAGAASALPLLHDRIIEVRRVPASVANAIWQSAEAVPVTRPHRIRRRCTMTYPAVHDTARP
ncbi:DUF6325 family protein [Microbacterium sp. H1-D42]|uniref:DUF6325 family protein n=1 Tax=Microbacterium sp. H1-D42 TaxID=2925844 RepID=UPI001F5318BA|nr:DUF6325 family protein [Microbacterium sp. H1-D42]UNK72365.1 DUF6325 family protein [Microbacterium sp. H1-D42]